ncbi:sulfotransferase domain-containing protein [Segnochrobactrum spirostomi]|uniref:sulfotransferase domain-containing protein n=1 Tax=Segnochrobactrum spirostomi TaxID=2608987 RepID=UPI001AD80A05|nr:sulfotransferase domain-containing protein [Segnochrobactrum spirostomi]
MSNTNLDESADVLCWQNASYNFISRKITDGFHFIRNPLDIIVSAYHSHKKTHPLDGWPELRRQREILATCDQAEGLFLTLSFLERDDFHPGAVGPLHALRHWTFEDARIKTLRTEDVVLDPNRYIGQILQDKFPGSVLPPTEHHTFEFMVGRRVGEIDEKSHYRSGKRDQWKEVLPREIVEYMKAHYREIFERFYPHVLSQPIS